MSDDAELLERIRGGATDEFAEIVRRHQSRVFAILHRYERDAHRVEDLAQETFLKAWRALAQFDGRAPFDTDIAAATGPRRVICDRKSGAKMKSPCPRGEARGEVAARAGKKMYAATRGKCKIALRNCRPTKPGATRQDLKAERKEIAGRRRAGKMRGAPRPPSSSEKRAKNCMANPKKN